MALAMDTVTFTGSRVEIENGFDFLSPEYAALYAASAATAFQAPLWMDHLHRRLAPALGAQRRTVTLRDGAGGLLAVFPFVTQRSRGVTLLQPADFGVCDYNAAVAPAETLERLATDKAFRKALAATFKGSDLVMFRKIRADGFDAGRLFDRPRLSEGENAAYACHIDADLDQWRLKTLKRKFTKELGRLQRQAESRHGSYEHRPVDAPEAVREAFAFLRLAREDRFESDLLDRPEYFAFYQDYAVEAVRRHEARLYVSYLDGAPVAALFGLTGDGDFHAVLIAADIAGYPKLSGGMQLLYQVARMRHRQGHRLLDMCLGDTGYKSQFRPERTVMRNLTLPLSLKGMAVSAIYHHAKPLKNLLRKGAQNVR